MEQEWSRDRELAYLIRVNSAGKQPPMKQYITDTAWRPPHYPSPALPGQRASCRYCQDYPLHGLRRDYKYPHSRNVVGKYTSAARVIFLGQVLCCSSAAALDRCCPYILHRCLVYIRSIPPAATPSMVRIRTAWTRQLASTFVKHHFHEPMAGRENS